MGLAVVGSLNPLDSFNWLGALPDLDSFGYCGALVDHGTRFTDLVRSSRAARSYSTGALSWLGSLARQGALESFGSLALVGAIQQLGCHSLMMVLCRAVVRSLIHGPALRLRLGL